MTAPKHKWVRGFTLVELIVSVGLFAVVVTMATGTYLVMINVSREAQSVATGINSLSFVLEGMTRNIRTGKGYQDCGSGSSTFSFFEDGDSTRRISYRLDSDRQVIQQNLNNGAWLDLTNPLIKVTSLSFECRGTTPGAAPNTTYGDFEQAHITINISGTVSPGPGKLKEFNVQSSATMRSIDF